eukprot:CAMPEP_0118638202 /NCGR_PEP_ID=MMETSP0785-20121206/3552_1 /TAXON_ID=91992 /ORGANISM="Bolidomonas pacifica, Strain CCMP 1866" /LENGTH=219 /DNA_ID=CAMNT_0006529423 /DNA_START=35 /DNA_END=690 /DNA_ORIENTATION=+
MASTSGRLGVFPEGLARVVYGTGKDATTHTLLFNAKKEEHARPTPEGDAASKQFLESECCKVMEGLPKTFKPRSPVIGCSVCGEDDEHGQMLLCDECGSEWHMQCLCPEVTEVPKGTWECWKCWKGKGGTEREIDVGRVEGDPDGDGKEEGEKSQGHGNNAEDSNADVGVIPPREKYLGDPCVISPSMYGQYVWVNPGVHDLNKFDEPNYPYSYYGDRG